MGELKNVLSVDSNNFWLRSDITVHKIELTMKLLIVRMGVQDFRFSGIRQKNVNSIVETLFLLFACELKSWQCRTPGVVHGIWPDITYKHLQ